MSYMHERKYARATALATALEERLLFEQHPGVAGGQPVGAVDWDKQSTGLAQLLSALAWAVAPTREGERPDSGLLDQLPAGLVADLRKRQRAGEPIAAYLTRASNDLTSGPGHLGLRDTDFIVEIARSAEGEAADALRRLAEF